MNRACSFWESLTEVKENLERNQYTPGFYDPIISSKTENITISDNDNETTSI